MNQDNVLTKYETIVLDSHDTLEDVLGGILNDDDDADDEDLRSNNNSVQDINEDTLAAEGEAINDED